MCTVRTALLLVIVSFIVSLAACSQQPTTPGILNLNIANDAAAHTHATVPLVHQPTGTADLVWNTQKKQLTVTIRLTGLAPKSRHPAHIHQGKCQAGSGAMLFALHDVVADAAGVGTSKTEITKNVNTISVVQGWYINIHNGPNLTPADQFQPIACGDIDSKQKQKIQLGATTAADNQHALGQAELTLQGNVLTVKVSVRGLVPGSAHMEHIHAGSCENQIPGKVLYMLQNLVADQNGSAQASTRIPNVKQIPAKGWYINVHRTTVLTDQTGFDPIDCGNIHG
jgi:Cu/Zn superoxide dismutase